MPRCSRTAFASPHSVQVGAFRSGDVREKVLVP
ncbi:hypothetical protein WG66_006090 [Moniliophthora roreri]|nr:hypothetical protein WG66_006090 [Moniliophthora roreri]